MAINQIPAFRTWVDGQSFSARDYIYERNIAVTKINELVVKTNLNDTRITALEDLTDQAVLAISDVTFNTIDITSEALVRSNATVLGSLAVAGNATITGSVTANTVNATNISTNQMNVENDITVPTHGSVVTTLQNLKNEKIDKIVSQYPKTTLGLGNGANQRIYIQDNLSASHLTIDELRTYIATNFASFGFVLAEPGEDGLPDVPEFERFDNKIYLIPNINQDGIADSYAEYLYIADNWEFIGTTGVELENYYTKTNIDALLGNQGDTVQTFYVAINGDDNNPGTEWLPFRTIKHACAAAAALPPESIGFFGPVRPLTSIRINSGKYFEQLPIVVPANTALVGTDLRTCQVYPAEGLSDDGVTNNNNSRMFLMSAGTLAMHLALYNMTGWVKPTNIQAPETVPAQGIGFALNPASPIFGASPYILDCSAFFAGGIGAYVDGNDHVINGTVLGNRSMLFYGYTNINDEGVGFWTDNGGVIESVSNFTYYAAYGYLATRGGYMRGLNGSNSWGTWALFANGFLPSETPLTATLKGNILEYSDLVTEFVAGETLVGETSGATATILNVQPAASVLYIEKTSDTTPLVFQNPGFLYNIDRFVGANPTVTLVRGKTYTFNFEAVSGTHPIALRLADGVTTAVPGTTGNDPVNGVFGPGAIVTYVVPNDAPNSIVYQCAVHGSMIGTINIVDTTPEFIDGEVITSASGDARALGSERGQNGGLLIVTGLAENPEIRMSISIADDDFTYVVASVSGSYVDANSIIILTLSTSKAVSSLAGTGVELRKRYSQIRVTGHDFLNVGTGGIASITIGGGTLINPGSPPVPGQQVGEFNTGRVFSISTDQDGNFKVGKFFGIDQGTGRATLDASAFDLSGLTSLRLGSIGAQLGESINEFSSDPNLTQNSNEKVPTQAAVRSFVTAQTILFPSVAIPLNGWTGASAPFTNTVTVTSVVGQLPTAFNVFIDLVLDELDFASWEAQEEDWAKIAKATNNGDGTITLYAKETIANALVMKVKGVK
jgi:hypothetical protein